MPCGRQSVLLHKGSVISLDTAGMPELPAGTKQMYGWTSCVHAFRYSMYVWKLSPHGCYWGPFTDFLRKNYLPERIWTWTNFKCVSVEKGCELESVKDVLPPSFVFWDFCLLFVLLVQRKGFLNYLLVCFVLFIHLFIVVEIFAIHLGTSCSCFFLSTLCPSCACGK